MAEEPDVAWACRFDLPTRIVARGQAADTRGDASLVPRPTPPGVGGETRRGAEADLKKMKRRRMRRGRCSKQPPGSVNAIDAEADAAARRALETDLAKTKADPPARRMNGRGR